MTWKIEFTPAAAKQLKKIGPDNGRRIIRFLRENVQADPYKKSKVLKGALRKFWRYRVGDFRVLARIERDRLVVLIVSVGHRRDVYR